MAISIGTTGNASGGASATVTVDGGSDRMFIVCLAQSRNPPNMATPVTLNGQAATGTLTTNFFDGVAAPTTWRLGVFYWLDTDLPSSGSYTLAWSGSSSNNRMQYANFTGVLQTSPVEDSGQYDSGNAAVHSVTLSPYSTDSLAIFFTFNASDNQSSASDGTFLKDGSRVAAAYRVDGATVGINWSSTDEGIGGEGSFKVASASKTVTVDLVDILGSAQASMTGLRWSWFNEDNPANFNAPSDEGTTETTDGSGTLVIDVPNTTLNSGQTGTLLLRNPTTLEIGAYRLTVD